MQTGMVLNPDRTSSFVSARAWMPLIQAAYFSARGRPPPAPEPPGSVAPNSPPLSRRDFSPGSVLEFVGKEPLAYPGV